jgi:hypothetical protein
MEADEGAFEQNFRRWQKLRSTRRIYWRRTCETSAARRPALIKSPDEGGQSENCEVCVPGIA